MSISNTLEKIFIPYKGILAIDERPTSLEKRFVKYAIEYSSENKDKYREILLSTPNIERTISGVILSEDTFCEHKTNGILTREYLNSLDMCVGVKVDEGLSVYENDKELMITLGLEGLDEKLSKYKEMGADFVKWRSVIPVNKVQNTDFIDKIASDMDKYANMAINHDLVPILEPELLIDGEHDLDVGSKALEEVLGRFFSKLSCDTTKTILKTSFAVAGLNREETEANVVAERTLEAFSNAGLNRKKAFYGIVFLSGGLSSDVAIKYIQCIKYKSELKKFIPFITFSYGRALQDSTFAMWGGEEKNIISSQLVFTQTLQHAIKKFKGVEVASSATDGKGI